MFSPSKETVEKLLAEYDTVPVSRGILSDVRTPMEVLSALLAVDDHCFILESIEDRQRWGRYTIIGFEPEMDIVCDDGKVTINEDGKASVVDSRNPSDVIRGIIAKHRSPVLEGMPPFTGGLVGYFSYDFIKYAEPSLRLDAKDDEGFKDIDLMLFDKVIVFDNFRQTITVIAHANSKRDYDGACAEIDRIVGIIKDGKQREHVPATLKSEFRAMHSEERYCEMVEHGKERIREGDIFQVVLSNRLEADFDGSLLDVYRVLRTTNPSPYMFYFSGTDIEVAGASPETLVKLKDGVLHTFPLAGTRPRGKTDEEDRRLEEELLADEKERAEHNMLVDLGRNDLGRVSEIGTVAVEKYMEIERFSHVMHIGSTVVGQIAEGKDAMDAIEAVLPAGTLSGAPKLMACRIIDDLEDCKRGIYGGAIGYIDLTGNMDVCIGIRIAYRKNGKVFVRSGAGIVADSVPKNEYRECINKAKAVIEAIERASEGLE
ncbi:MAG: anthranilate synthase component I [Thermoplasmata archaeon]|nr:anthranilate synthase component I [Thermoplasmata archaeon]